MKIRSKLSYANVMSTLCLFLLLGGGAAFAATKLAKNSVGSNQLKKNSVTAAKIKSGAVTGAKIKLSSVGTVPSASDASTLGGRPPSDFASPAVVRTVTLSATGVVDAPRSVGVSQANVTHRGTGSYCINGLTPSPTTAIAAPTFGGTLGSDFVVRAQETEPDCQVIVQIYNVATNPADEPFIMFLR